MSHFCVIVIGDNVEQQLQPYHEYGCTGIDDEYVIDVDVTDQARADFAEMGKGRSFEQFVEDWYGRQPNADGRVIEHTNPNAKWDWWVIGGRWSGWLGRDQGRRSEFDLDGLRDRATAKALADYDRYHPGIDPPDAPWAEFRQRYASIEEAREAWWSHPFCAALRQADVWLEPDDFMCDRDTYAARARVNAVVPFALVAEGQWAARGDMGWWATVSNERPEGEWEAFVNHMLDNLDGDTLLTVVDCHI